MLIDEVKIKVKAGDGGAGRVAFHKIKGMQGPSGGNGGRGGSIIMTGVSDLGALRYFRNRKEFKAEGGNQGSSTLRDGAAGEDLHLKVPVGTVIHKPDGDTDVVELGEEVVVAQGGKGGRGNFKFRSSTKTTPKYAQPGLPGEEFEVNLELQLIADIGFVGLPNAGKSSLLNELSPKTGARVDNYPFTTLEPNLGVYYAPGVDFETEPGLILADIPGLIEGASEGKGLGIKFLRHIKRTKILFHCIDASSKKIVSDYKAIRSELKGYDKELDKKKEYVFLTKTDLIDKEALKKKKATLKKYNSKIQGVSIYDFDSIEKVKGILNKIKI